MLKHPEVARYAKAAAYLAKHPDDKDKTKNELQQEQETLLSEIAELKVPLTEVQEDLKKLRDIRYWVRKATPGTEAVSYTHLGFKIRVRPKSRKYIGLSHICYKKLELERQKLVEQAKRIARPSEGKRPLDEIRPVSYTHLDVYKRQSGKIANLSMIWIQRILTE